jgi:nucleotide-binding universal stress UspA family protein
MLHVIPDPLTMGWGTDEARLPRMLDEADDAVRARADQLRTVQTGEVETRIAVDTGPPDDRIVQYADTRAIDLIVMVPRGRNAVEKAWIGSITDAVLRRAHCPVTVVPALP